MNVFARFLRWLEDLPPVFCIPRALPPLPGLRVRQYDVADFEACLRLYEENEPGRFPPNTAPLYADHLNKTEGMTLVLEQDGKIVGVGGISLKPDPAVSLCCWLSFGLIAPAHHRRGLGTVLLLARIARLPADLLPVPAFLMAVKSSRSFYERFGFRLFCKEVLEAKLAGYLVTRVPPEAVEEARACLRASGVEMSVGGSVRPASPRAPAESPEPLTAEYLGVRWLQGDRRSTFISQWRPDAPGSGG